MRTLALDMGDVWVGTAISDGLGITCRPLETVKRPELVAFLTKIIPELGVQRVVVGLPVSMTGNETEQTRKTRAVIEKLQKQFHTIEWVTADECMTSQQATAHQRDVKKQRRSSESKKQSHSLAAAFILQQFLN